MPVNQMNGVHIDVPQLPVLLQFQSVKDYRDYISRLHKCSESLTRRSP